MQESALFEEMRQLEEAIDPDEVIFVLDGTIGQAASAQAQAFADAVSIGSIIVTKLDSSAKGGGALSAVAATKSPISYYGTGEGMQMLEEFDANGFVSRMLGLGDAHSLARRIEQIDKDKQKEITDSILKGQFTFKELYSQYQTVLEMGDLGSLVDSMGLAKALPRGLSSANMEENVKRMLIVMDSMTDREMGQPDLLRDESRKRRIAAGCGLPLAFVQYVVDEQKRWAQMFKKMDRGALSRLAQVETPKGMNNRQMQQDLHAMARSMNPQMLQQLGGINGLSQIMQKTWEAEKQAKATGGKGKK
jgi:signal recognition particle subunit SRP54